MNKQIKAIFAKEFYGYFRSISAYFIMGLYIALSLLCCFVFGNFFEIDNQSMISFFQYQPDILAALIPGITMHLWTDEYRTGTIEFILTQPIKYKDIVIGKYLAAAAFSLIMLSMIIPLVVVLWLYNDINLSAIISALVSCVLIVLSFCAVGELVSSVSSRPVIAYLGSLFIIWSITMFSPDVLSENTTLSGLSFRENYKNLINGKIELSSIIYYLSMAGAGLWATVAIISNRNKV